MALLEEIQKTNNARWTTRAKIITLHDGYWKLQNAGMGSVSLVYLATPIKQKVINQAALRIWEKTKKPQVEIYRRFAN